jgi:hypothetical protein
MTDAQLMQQIKSEMGDYIAGAVEGTPFPAALVAALVANESGGLANAQRFEPAVFASLCQVLTGQKVNYAPAGCKMPIGAVNLMPLVWPQTTLASNAVKSTDVFTFPQGILGMMNLATSWGPTQIMGWHSIEFGYQLGDLPNLHTHFEHAVQLLEWFDERYKILAKAGTEFDTAELIDLIFPTPEVEKFFWMVMGEFFHCWNTGSPVAPTYDPDYVANGIARMKLYGES